jgi:ribulose 1,5-bisphosphate synthetase/thiazole synthase
MVRFETGEKSDTKPPLRKRGQKKMKQFYEEKPRRLPISYTCDVLVVGGGTAGIVAALAAAETGAKTILVEKSGFLGGAMIHGAIVLHSFFNLYRAFPGVPKVQLVRGIPEKIVQAMIRAGGCPGHVEADLDADYDSVATCFDPEIFKRVAFDLMEEAGVKLLMHTFMVDTICEENTVQGIITETKSGREAIMAKVVVDCTGDGDVAFYAGAECLDKKRESDYAVANTFGMGNVDLLKAKEFLQERGFLRRTAYGYKGSHRDDVIRLGFDLRDDEYLGARLKELGIWGPMTASTRENQLTYINCTNIRGVDAIDRDDMTKAEVFLRRQLVAAAEFLQKNIPGFENSYLNWSSPQICIRRTRTVVCEYDITNDDVIEARGFSDEVARYGFHDLAPTYKIRDGGSYGIPYRALLPKKIDNLLVSGRMITSDYKAHMSTRNTVCCMVQGHAAGTAAAMAASKGITPRALSVKELQDRLEEQDVYIERIR